MSRNARSGASVSFLAALVVALLGMSAPAHAASVQETFAVSFGNLVPGESRSASQAVTVPTEATLSVAHWERTGHEGFAWEVRLCGADCRVLTPTTGAVLPAGVYRLEIAVTAGDVPMASEAALVGRFVLTEVTDELPMTGVEVVGLGLAAVVLTGLGFWLLLVARRKEEDR